MSILNVDYKLLSAISANRLGNIVHHYTEKDQMVFIKGRYLRDVRKVLNIVDKAKVENVLKLLLMWILKRHLTT